MRIVTVVGARPQFVKAAAVSRLLRLHHTEILVHTGQHYDPGLSQVFFDELGIPEPDYHLKVGSGPHGRQTGLMLERVEEVLEQEKPDLLLVYGDTNSTLAAALAAVKLHIPVAHVEAGLRSFDLGMPEEVNRRLTDHISRVLFTPTAAATAQLHTEGIVSGVHQVGDVMYDVLLQERDRARATSHILAQLALEPGGYVLATIHRAENTDDPGRLRAILTALHSAPVTVVLPLHPRTRARIADFGIEALLESDSLRVTPPVGYLDMLNLEENARQILTDSGGVQKEAYLLGVPCLTLRERTEWLETVGAGWNQLLGADGSAIAAALANFHKPDRPRPAVYGDGHAAQRIAAVFAGLQLDRPDRG